MPALGKFSKMIGLIWNILYEQSFVSSCMSHHLGFHGVVGKLLNGYYIFCNGRTGTYSFLQELRN